MAKLKRDDCVVLMCGNSKVKKRVTYIQLRARNTELGSIMSAHL